MRLNLRRKNNLVLLIVWALVTHTAVADELPRNLSVYFVQSTHFSYGQDSVTVQNQETYSHVQSNRKLTATIYSTILPGSGQTMLGHHWKGLSFTVLSVGSMITSIISHNNYIARQERLDALEFQYRNSTNWVTSEFIYSSMKDTHRLYIKDRNRRNLFAVIAVVVWSVNIADILYNSEDLGETVFSNNRLPQEVQPAFVSMQRTSVPMFSVSIPLGK